MPGHEVTLDLETLDRITIAGLREWRVGCVNSKSNYTEDKKADAMRIAAIDVLLAYNGAI